MDIFVTAPFPLDEEYNRAMIKPLGAIPVRFVTLETLIEMKEMSEWLNGATDP